MADDSDNIARIALGIAGSLGTTDPGEKAQARRMDGRGAPVFWREVARLGISPHHETSWLRFTRMVALLTPASATQSIHQPGRRLGAVLADGGDASADLRVSGKPVVSEQRLARLLASRDEARLDALERAIRMLARARPRIDVVSLAWAIMAPASNALARDYYTRIDRSPAREVEYV